MIAINSNAHRLSFNHLLRWDTFNSNLILRIKLRSTGSAWICRNSRTTGIALCAYIANWNWLIVGNSCASLRHAVLTYSWISWHIWWLACASAWICKTLLIVGNFAGDVNRFIITLPIIVTHLLTWSATSHPLIMKVESRTNTTQYAQYLDNNNNSKCYKWHLLSHHFYKLHCTLPIASVRDAAPWQGGPLFSPLSQVNDGQMFDWVFSQMWRPLMLHQLKSPMDPMPRNNTPITIINPMWWWFTFSIYHWCEKWEDC